MNEYECHLLKIFDVFNKENILNNIIVIGSWSLFFYSKVFDNFKPLIRTTDVDFYIPNAKSIKGVKTLTSSLKNIDFDLFKDTMTEKTRYICHDGFEIEFLTKLNRENLSCVKIGDSGIVAESLHYLDIFTYNYIEVNYEGFNVKVATPSSYILQKMIINSEREHKSEKDIQSIKYVLDYIKTSPKSFNELKTLYSSLPKSWQKKIIKIAKEKNICLE